MGAIPLEQERVGAHRPLDPVPDLVPALVKEKERRDRLALALERKLEQIEIIVASDEAHLEGWIERDDLHENWNVQRTIGAPIFADDQHAQPIRQHAEEPLLVGRELNQ